MKRVKFIVAILSINILFSCNQTDLNKPTEQANNTLSGLDGEYIVTDMVWEDDPTRLFDLNNDGKEALLFDELRSFEERARGKAYVSFSCISGPIQGYHLHCDLSVPVQFVDDYTGSVVGHVIDFYEKEAIVWPFSFSGSIYPDGKLEWESYEMPILPDVHTATSCLDKGGTSQIITHTKECMQVDVAYRLFLPKTRTYESGKVLVTLKRENKKIIVESVVES